jgi:thiol-disulfide isomerase/thioredoxin
MHYITTLNLIVNDTKTEKKMSDLENHDLEKIRLKKAEMLVKAQTMPTEVVKIHSAEEFDKLTQDFSDKVIIIDFWAVWCSPCTMFAPIFEKLQKERFLGGLVFSMHDVCTNIRKTSKGALSRFYLC